MSVKRGIKELREDSLPEMEKLSTETEEQHQEKHYKFDQILQLQNKQLLELEREQKKQQEELKIKQQKQKDNLQKLLNMDIPFKEKQRVLNEQKNNLLKRAKYRQEILDDQPPVEMALKMVLYFQHQHHQDTYNLLLYQHNQLQHAKTRKEQAHLFLLHQQMYLKLFDIQQKVLLQTLVEQQELAELECSALRHLSINDNDNADADINHGGKEEDDRTIVVDSRRDHREEDIIPSIDLPQAKDFENLKQMPIPATPNQVYLPKHGFGNHRGRSHSHSRGRSRSRSCSCRRSNNDDSLNYKLCNRSFSRGSNGSATTSTTMSFPLFSFASETIPNETITLDQAALNEKINKPNSILSRVLDHSKDMDDIDDHRRKEKEFMERSERILQCKNVKDITIDVPIPKNTQNEINPKTKKNIDDFFYRAYQKYSKSKFVTHIRQDMVKDGIISNSDEVFQSGFDDDDDMDNESNDFKPSSAFNFNDMEDHRHDQNQNQNLDNNRDNVKAKDIAISLVSSQHQPFDLSDDSSSSSEIESHLLLPHQNEVLDEMKEENERMVIETKEDPMDTMMIMSEEVKDKDKEKEKEKEKEKDYQSKK
jgi:hypothetical protein